MSTLVTINDTKGEKLKKKKKSNSRIKASKQDYKSFIKRSDTNVRDVIPMMVLIAM